MPDDITTKFADFLLRHQHYLYRVENGAIQAMEAPYKAAKADIYNRLVKLQETPLKPGNIPAVREWRLGRLNSQLTEVENVLSMARADSVGALHNALTEVANVENATYTKMLVDSFEKIGIDIVGLPYEQINFIIDNPLIYQYRGLSIPEGSFFNDQKFVSQIRRNLTQSIIQGEDMGRATRRLVNPTTVGLTGLAEKELSKYIKMVARSEIQHVSNSVNRAIYAANQDVLKGVIYSSALDRRTCLLPDSEILTNKGYKKIKYVNIGDDVLTHTNTYRKVITKSSKKVKKYLKIKLSNGRILKITADHQVMTFNNEWVEIGKLKVGDKINGY